MNDCQTLELENKIDKHWDLAVECYRRATEENEAVFFMHFKTHAKQLSKLMGEPATAVEQEVQAYVEWLKEYK
jgi:hypothetical protein